MSHNQTDLLNFLKKFKGKSYSNDVTPSALAKMFEGFSCAKIEASLNRAALLAGQGGREAFTMEDVKQSAKEV